MELSLHNETRARMPMTVGQRLRAARESKGLTLRDMAAITKIQGTMLQYLEEDRYDEFPAEVFARGFLRNYVRELRLDEAEMLELYRSQSGAVAHVTAPIVIEEPVRKAFIDPHKLATPSNISRIAYGVGLAVIVVGIALSILVLGGNDDSSAAASYTNTSYGDSWQPIPAGDNDWQTYREN